jgi:hypothetical protein
MGDTRAFKTADVTAVLADRDKRIEALEAGVERLRPRSQGLHDGTFG